MKKLAGVDDAGRGCVIGPLIIAGVLVNEERIIELENIGVRDSKKLSSKKREDLALEIEGIVSRSVYFEITPRAIDLVVERKKKLRKLNYLEAMAMAKPIVATHVQGIIEQISHEKEGILIQPRNREAIVRAVERLLADREFAHNLGLAARSKVENCFSVDKMVKETEAVYLSLLKTS